MKPTQFTYHRAKTLNEALELLVTYPDEAKVIAGGQSLVPLMNMRLARPGHLIDINDIQELSYIRQEGDTIKVGALTRHAELEQSPLLRESCPILPVAVHHIGHYAIRKRGTLGGSIAHADPTAELPLISCLLNAELTLTSSSGERHVRAQDFFLSIYTTDLMPDELLTAVAFPVLSPTAGWSYQQFSRRAGDFAIVSAATVLALNTDGTVSSLRITLGGADFTPLNRDVTEYLGELPSETWMRSVTNAVLTDLDPESDLHATAADRLDWLRVLVEQSLEESLKRLSMGGIRN